METMKRGTGTTWSYKGILLTDRQYSFTKNKHMKKEKLRLVQLSTTQFEELDALLVTDLTDEEIESVVYPITENDSAVYTNFTLVDALREKFPDKQLTAYELAEVSLLAI